MFFFPDVKVVNCSRDPSFLDDKRPKSMDDDIPHFWSNPFVGFHLSQVPSSSSAPVEGQPLLPGGLAAGLAGENFLSVARNGYAGSRTSWVLLIDGA